MLGNCSCFFCHSADIFQNEFFSKNSLSVKRSDPDQAPHVVGPDLTQNCLQRSSADAKIGS